MPEKVYGRSHQEREKIGARFAEEVIKQQDQEEEVTKEKVTEQEAAAKDGVVDAEMLPDKVMEDPDEDMGNMMNVMLPEPMEVDKDEKCKKNVKKMRCIKEFKQIGEILRGKTSKDSVKFLSWFRGYALTLREERRMEKFGILLMKRWGTVPLRK